MTWALEPVRIAASNVVIRNYDRRDIPRIAKAIDDPRGWFGIHWEYDSPEKIVRVLESQLAAWQAGTANPLAYFVGDEAAGITRFLRIEPREKTLEIGGTWVAPKWRKTFVNTKVKFLLLRHCFETLAAERVEFRVDARNTQSQEAVLRLGATLEGRLRHRQLYPDGKMRDGFLFSIIRPEWDRVKIRLLALLRNLAREESRAARLPRVLETLRLSLRRYEAADAQAIFELVDKNRADLTQSFPRTVAALRTPGMAENHVIDKLYQWHARTAFNYGAFLKSSGRLIGHLHVLNINWDVPSAELGYFVDAAHRRRGLAREMTEAVLQDCLGRFRRVALRILPWNQPSLGLAEALGFEREGLHRNEFLEGSGELSDIVYFSRFTQNVLSESAGQVRRRPRKRS